jgi:hypothetical protein
MGRYATGSYFLRPPPGPWALPTAMARNVLYRMGFLLALASGCGSSADSDLDAGPGSGGGGGGGGSGGDAASPTETKSGNLTISSSRYTVSTTTVEQGYASGTFYRLPPVTGTGTGGGCTTTKTGDCDVQTCTFTSTPTDGGLSITYTDAGPLTISGVLVNDGSMTMSPGPYGYTTVSGAVALFDGGDTVRFVASGNANGAPGFDVSLVAPSMVQVTAPAFVQGKVAASTSSNLAIAWSGSTSGANVTAQVAAGTSGYSVVARCTYAGTTGHGVIPASVIAAVDSVGGYASITVMTESRTTREPDGWNIAVALQSYGLVTSGLAAGTLEIQ